MKYKKMIALIAAAGMIGTLGGCGLKAPEKPSQAPSRGNGAGTKGDVCKGRRSRYPCLCRGKLH